LAQDRRHCHCSGSSGGSDGGSRSYVVLTVNDWRAEASAEPATALPSANVKAHAMPICTLRIAAAAEPDDM
jgi:hypothetical protein